MAKITITIEDVGNRVRVVCNPSFDAIAKIVVTGHGHTLAHGYAIAAVNRILKLSKEMVPLHISLPPAKKGLS